MEDRGKCGVCLLLQWLRPHRLINLLLIWWIKETYYTVHTVDIATPSMISRKRVTTYVWNIDCMKYITIEGSVGYCIVAVYIKIQIKNTHMGTIRAG